MRSDLHAFPYSPWLHLFVNRRAEIIGVDWMCFSYDAELLLGFISVIYSGGA